MPIPTATLSTFLLTLALLLSAPPASAQSSTPAGEWEGVADGPAGSFRVVLHLENDDGVWRGTFSLPAEGVALPLSEVRHSADSVWVSLTPERELRGAVSTEGIVGVLDFEGRLLPLTLARAGSPAARRLADDVARAVEEARAVPMVAASPVEIPAAMDRDAVERLLEAAQAAHSDALVVLHEGDVVGAWHKGGERRKIELMSATKSILNLAVGRLLTTGALASVDEPVHHYYPDWGDGGKAAITVRHLLNHTSGIDSPMPTGPIYASGDFVRFALEAEVISEPGMEIVYNNNATNLLAGLVEEVAGERLDLYLGSDLFARLGITDFGWTLDEAGNPHGMSGLQMHAEDLATLGQLVLQRGRWNGEQLIDESWFDESLQPGSDLSDGVGLLWWLIREDDEIVGYRADGYLGQYLIIHPDQNLVAARLVAQTAAYNPETDGFRDFQDLVRELIPRSLNGLRP